MDQIINPEALPQSEWAEEFRKRFFPEATLEDWNNWKWQLRNRLTNLQDFQKIFSLSKKEEEAIDHHRDRLPLGITPYYAGVMSQSTSDHEGLQKTLIPSPEEFQVMEGESIDPLNEENQSPVRSIVHRYPDRVLFLVTQNCAVYCRYCTRGRLVGQKEEKFSKENWEEGLEYIRQHPEIRDVLLSGGDALFLGDVHLEWLVRELRNIPHVELIRLGTKIPMVLPQRITPALIQMLRKYHPVFFSVHVTHLQELTPEVHHAASLIADGGIVMGSQTVLLKGVNDNKVSMKRLMQKLLNFRIRPYVLYQCDPIYGSAHFRVPIQKGIEMIEALRGHTTGYAVPAYIIDPPGGAGKINLAPDVVLGRDDHGYWLKNWEGKKVFYPEPKNWE